MWSRTARLRRISSPPTSETCASGTGCRLVSDNSGGFPDCVFQTAVSDTDCLGAMSISGKSRNIQPFGTAAYGIAHSPSVLASSHVVMAQPKSRLRRLQRQPNAARQQRACEGREELGQAKWPIGCLGPDGSRRFAGKRKPYRRQLCPGQEGLDRVECVLQLVMDYPECRVLPSQCQ